MEFGFLEVVHSQLHVLGEDKFGIICKTLPSSSVNGRLNFPSSPLRMLVFAFSIQSLKYQQSIGFLTRTNLRSSPALPLTWSACCSLRGSCRDRCFLHLRKLLVFLPVISPYWHPGMTPQSIFPKFSFQSVKKPIWNPSHNAPTSWEPCCKLRM